MITDDPDEDTNNLDDDALLAAYFDQTKPSEAAAQSAEDELPDWPPAYTRDIGVTVDRATLAWFKANHSDWRREMGFVLRAWVATKSERVTTVQPLDTTGI